MNRPPPRSPLFPYPTLFRSEPPANREDSDFSCSDYLRSLSAACSLGWPTFDTKSPGNRFELGHRLRVPRRPTRSEEHTSELQSPCNLVCRLLLEKKKNYTIEGRFRAAVAFFRQHHRLTCHLLATGCGRSRRSFPGLRPAAHTAVTTHAAGLLPAR